MEKAMIKARVEMLKQMDNYVRNIIGDDSVCVDLWFAEGVPDGADEIDLIEIAEDDDLWEECVKCFAECCEEETYNNLYGKAEE